MLLDSGRHTQVFSLISLPPKCESIPPRSVVFLLDKSGSMQGDNKFSNACTALKNQIRLLEEEDLVNVTMFDVEAYKAFPFPIKADSRCKRCLCRFVDSNVAGGGTRFLEPLCQTCESLLPDKSRFPAVILLTDGMDNEDGPAEFYKALKRRTGFKIPVYAYAIGKSTNESLLRLISRMSGASTYKISDSKEIAPSVGELSNRLDRAIGIGSKVKVESGSFDEVFAPDSTYMIEDELLSACGRLRNNAECTLTLSARINGKEWSVQRKVSTSGMTEECMFLDCHWACQTVRYLIDENLVLGESKGRTDQIISYSKRYMITTPWTSLVFSELGERVKPPESDRTPRSTPKLKTGSVHTALPKTTTMSRERLPQPCPTTGPVRTLPRSNRGTPPVRTLPRSNRGTPPSTNITLPPSPHKQDKATVKDRALKNLPGEKEYVANALVLAMTAFRHKKRPKLVNHALENICKMVKADRLTGCYVSDLACAYGLASLPAYKTNRRLDVDAVASEILSNYKREDIEKMSSEQVSLSSLFLSGLAKKGHKLSRSNAEHFKHVLMKYADVDLASPPVGKDMQYVKRWLQWFPVGACCYGILDIKVPDKKVAKMFGVALESISHRSEFSVPDTAFILSLHLMRQFAKDNGLEKKLDIAISSARFQSIEGEKTSLVSEEVAEAVVKYALLYK
ncbi:MAG: VWA domain-containing protein [Planctomycetota bacterium]|nr:VWA domain-containing protein [Planctomycetota bacterium]